MQGIRPDAVAFGQVSVRGAEHHLLARGARGRMHGRSEFTPSCEFLVLARLCVDQDSD